MVSQRTQKTLIDGYLTSTDVAQNVPIYQIITPGGDTQSVFNFEYRIPILGPVTLAPFFDAGLNKIVYTNQLKVNPGQITNLNGQFPEAAFDDKVRIAPGTQAIRMSTGLEIPGRAAHRAGAVPRILCLQSGRTSPSVSAEVRLAHMPPGSSVAAQHDAAGVEEHATGGDQRVAGSRDLAGPGFTPQLDHGFAEVIRTLNPTIGEAAAVGVDRHPPAEEEPIGVRIPVVVEKVVGFAVPAEPERLEPTGTDHREPVVREDDVHLVEGYLTSSMELASHDLLSGVAQIGHLVFLGEVRLTHHRCVDEHRCPRQVAGSVRGCHDECIGSVDRIVHIVNGQRLADHACGEVLIHGERLPHGRMFVSDGVGPAVDGHLAQHVSREVELGQVVTGPRCIPDRRGKRVRVGSEQIEARPGSFAKRVGTADRETPVAR